MTSDFLMGILVNLKKGTFPADRLNSIANYLNLSPQYIMTGQENEIEQYYHDEETVQMAQEIFENKELRLLFSAARDASPEDLKTTHDMLMALKCKERGYNDDTGA